MPVEQLIQLDARLDSWCEGDTRRDEIARTVKAMASACCSIAAMLADGEPAADARAHDAITAAAAIAPVAELWTASLDSSVRTGGGGSLALVVKPLDGALGPTGMRGTIFSILGGPAPFLARGRRQVAAGLVVYGPATSLALTVGAGTDQYLLNGRTGEGRFIRALGLPTSTRDCAIDVSRYRRWPASVRTYVDDLFAGSDGPRGADADLRWSGVLSADALRILNCGGVFVSPPEERVGGADGRLRLIDEANPLAFLVEQAGGMATDGTERLLDKRPSRLQQRTPMIFGDPSAVTTFGHYMSKQPYSGEHSPLFGRRGLFRA